MIPRGWVVVFLGVIGLSAALAGALAGLEPAAWGPFVVTRLAVAHLVAAGPLVLWGVPALARGRILTWPGWAKGLAGLGLVGFTLGLFLQLGTSTTTESFGPLGMPLLRVGLAALVWLPGAVLLAGTPFHDRLEFAPAHPGLTWCLLAALAWFPPLMLARALETQHWQRAQDYLAAGRVQAALKEYDDLAQLGCDASVGQLSFTKMHERLRGEVAALRKSFARPLPPQARPAEQFARAELAMQLDEWETARQLLRPLTARSLVATMNLAAVERDAGDLPASTAAFQLALEKIATTDTTHPDAAEFRRLAYLGLARNATQQRDPQQAASWLEAGLTACPESAAEFHYERAVLAAEAGRPGQAREQLELARQRDPKQWGPRADEFLRQLRTRTPICWQ